MWHFRLRETGTDSLLFAINSSNGEASSKVSEEDDTVAYVLVRFQAGRDDLPALFVVHQDVVRKETVPVLIRGRVWLPIPSEAKSWQAGESVYAHPRKSWEISRQPSRFRIGTVTEIDGGRVRVLVESDLWNWESFLGTLES